MKANATGVQLWSLTYAAVLLAAPIYTLAAPAPQPGKVAATKPPAATAPPIDEGPWLLAGGEGTCLPLSILEKKDKQLKGIHSPLQLSEKLKALGHAAEVKVFKAGVRPAVEVRAPSAGLHVMFVRQENCDKKTPVDAKKER